MPSTRDEKSFGPQSLRVLLQLAPRSIRLSLPGALLTIAVWAITFTRMGYADWVEDQYWLWQVLGRSNLADFPLASLLSLHTQPPGLNVLLAIDLAFTSNSHLTLGIMFLVLLLLALFGTVDTLTAVGSSKAKATAAGLLFAVLPTPVVYSLWPFSTLPTMAAATLSVWGIARLRTKPVVGVAISSIGILTLFLFRSSFVWVFVVTWLGALAFACFRARRSRAVLTTQFIILALVLALTGLVQAHHLRSFGNMTLSSWGGQNTIKALLVTGALVIEPDTEQELRADPCASQILDSLLNGISPFMTDPRDPLLCKELQDLDYRGIPAWDEPLKDGDERNWNWSRELAVSQVYDRIARRVWVDNPLQALSVGFAPEQGPAQSGLAIYLRPSEDYSLVEPIRQHHPLAAPGGVLSVLFAPAMMAVGSIGIVRVLRNRKVFGRLLPTYAAVTVLLAFHVTVSTMLEYDENMRFQAEMFPVLILFGFMGLEAIAQSSGDRPPLGSAPDRQLQDRHQDRR